MKKIICILLAALLVLCVCGCNNDTAPTTEATNGASEPTLAGGLEDSIFDSDATTPSTTKPADQTTEPQGTTEPSQTTEPEATTEATEGTEPATTTEPAKPTEPDVTVDPNGSQGGDPMGYKEFQAMTPAQQRAFQESFGEGEEGLDAFFAWYNAAKEAYEKENPPIEIGNGVIDLDKLLGGNG